MKSEIFSIQKLAKRNNLALLKDLLMRIERSFKKTKISLKWSNRTLKLGKHSLIHTKL